MRFLPSLFSQLFLHLVSFSLQCLVCALLYCMLTVLCQVALTGAWERRKETKQSAECGCKYGELRGLKTEEGHRTPVPVQR
jgi:hypothetical protein